MQQSSPTAIPRSLGRVVLTLDSNTAVALAVLVVAATRILKMGGSSYESGKDNEDGTASASSPVPSGIQTKGNDRLNEKIPQGRHYEQRSSSGIKEQRKRKKNKKSDRSVDERKEKESKKCSRKRMQRSSSSSSSSDHGYQDDVRRTHTRARKHDKKTKRSSRHRDERGHHSSNESSANPHRSRGTAADPALGRNYTLADALCRLLENYTALASELPIMLIRLCGGTTFDFSRMPDSRAAESLDNVFSCLQHFGGVRTGEGAWKWENPAASRTPGQATPVESELTLVRVIQALLEQIGLSVQALDDSENKKHAPTDGLASESTRKVISKRAADHHMQQQEQLHNDKDEEIVRRQATELLQQFGQEAMAGELAGLCSMILEDEIVALTISALSNAELRKKLELLFDSCGLQVCEMDESRNAGDDSDNDNECANDREPALGYGLPEHDGTVSKEKLLSVINVCRYAVECKDLPDDVFSANERT